MNQYLKIKNLSVIIFLISSFSIHSKAQTNQDLARIESQAKIDFQQYEYLKALPAYKLLDSLEPNNPRLMYPLALCYMNQLNNEKALPYLEKCLENPEKYPKNLDFYAGKAYQLSHQFDNAIIHYEIYLHKLGKSKKNKMKTREIQHEIENCNYAKQLMANPIKVKIENMGSKINSQYSEYGAVLSADEQIIIFTSARPNTTGGQIDESDGRFFEDIYISYKEGNEWSSPVQIGAGINTNGNDASIGLSPDGQKLLLYRHQSEKLGTSSSRDLYMSRLKGTTWTQATKLPEPINSKAWEPSACLSSDERILYFTSDREDGFGGTDIYMVRQLPNGDWALPMNMGNKINTPLDEDAPYILPDGKTLYFSSNGHRTMGGFDMFVSKYDDEKKEWSTPENLGYPLNTASDDIHFSWAANGTRIYFSSIRSNGYGENDIYYADIEKESSNILILKGQVLDSLTNAPIEATITVLDSKSEIIGIFNSNSSTGKYIITFKEGKNYQLKIEAEPYSIHYENINAMDAKGFKEILKNILLYKK